MGFSSVRIQGADTSTTNLDNVNHAWVPYVQVTTKTTRLHKISYTNLTATDQYLWVFDTAAGDTATSVAPVVVRFCPALVNDTWDLGDAGCLFINGIFVAMGSIVPVDPTSTVGALAANTSIIKVETRLV
jgi:hypothetical protein